MPEQKKILVVDDEPQVCEAVKMLLEFAGHEVITAGNGSEALALFDHNEFHVVVTDYKMSGMKGDELAQALKARRPGQPVIMLTAHAEMIKTTAVPLAGVDQLVSKPFQLADLEDAIKKATARRFSAN